MVKKKKKRVGEIFEAVEITNAGAEGQCVAKVDGKVIFVEKAVPGDVADLKISSDRKGWMMAKIINLKSSSPDRVPVFCEHYNICGGCKWQQMDYAAQLKYKHQQVVDAFQRIAKVEVNEWQNIAAANPIRHYRNKLEFSFTDKAYLEIFDPNNPEHMGVKALGYHVPGMFDKIFNVEKCYLMPDLMNEIRNALKDFCMQNEYTFFNVYTKKGLMRDVMIRSTKANEWMVVVMFGDDQPEYINAVMDFLKQKFPQITSLHYTINTKVNDSIHDLDIINVSGDPWLTEQLGDLKFRIRPKSFFQTNPTQGHELYKIAKEFAQLKGDEIVYDLYSGTGTIGLFVSDQCKKVVGIEYIEDAVKDAYENAQLNDIHHCEFYAGDMAKLLNTEFIQKHGKPNVIITDPPRNGMHADVIKSIIEAAPEKIVYVSCNPATQARDLALLDEFYRVEKVRPVDMFPHTHHVENVALLVRR